jgi:signal transduction histidine kinase
LANLWPLTVSFDAQGNRVESWIITKFFPLFFFAFLIWGSVALIRSYRRSTGITKRQVQYFFLGLILTCILASILLPVLYQNLTLINVGPLGIFFLFGFNAYAILRYRLMDIRFILSRSIVYALLVTVVMGTFALVTYLGSTYFTSVSQTGQTFVLGITSFIIVILIDPFKKLLAKVTNKIFFKAAIDYPVVTTKLTNIINEEIDLAALIERFSDSLENELRLQHATVLLPVGETTYLEPEELQHEQKHKRKSKNNQSVYSDSPIIHHLIKNDEIIILDELDRLVSDAKTEKDRDWYDKMRQNLEAMGGYAAVPVKSKNKLEAILILTRKLSGEAFSLNDIQLLQVIAPQVASGIQKARLYQEAKEFNVKLERKVDEATLDLREANEKLTALDQAKSEFMSIASHQLRTPLAGIIGYLDMLNEEDYGKLDEKQKPIIHDVLEASQRLSRLVNTLLNVTRIEAGRFVMNYTKVPFADVIESMYKELKPTATKKNVKLIYNKQPLPEIEVDTDKIKDVLLNLTDNAIKYTPKGTVEIFAEATNKTVHVWVKDTGVGIDPKEVNNLFSKFVRGSEIARVNPNGSGLGLFIAKKAVEGHGGKIWAASEGKGKGTEFHFEIPIVASKEAKKAAEEFHARAQAQQPEPENTEEATPQSDESTEEEEAVPKKRSKSKRKR